MSRTKYQVGKSYDGCRYLGTTKDGQHRWRIEIYRGYKIVNGKKRNEYDRFTVRGSLREAKKRKAELETQRDKGTYTPPARITLGEFLTRYMTSTVKREVKASTYDRYYGIVTKHVIPLLGGLPIQRLTTRDLDDLYELGITSTTKELTEGRFAGKRGLGLKPATVRKMHNVLRKALNKAKAESLIAQNPAIEATPPSVPRNKFTVLSQEQLDFLLDTALEVEKFKRWHALFYTLAYTGMRLGEALGLRWANVDLDAGTIYIIETYDGRRGEDIDWGIGKSENPARTVRIEEHVVEVLRRHHAYQEWIKEQEGHRYRDMGLVFTTLTGYPPNPSNLRNRVLRPLIEEANRRAEEFGGPKIPRIKIHELRHTHATLLLKAGVNEKVVQERLGHGSVRITMDFYSQVTPDMEQEALEKYAAKREQARLSLVSTTRNNSPLFHRLSR